MENQGETSIVKQEYFLISTPHSPPENPTPNFYIFYTTITFKSTINMIILNQNFKDVHEISLTTKA